MIEFLYPSTNDYLWGGTRLSRDFNKGPAGELIAESWELSCHPDGSSFLADGTPLGRYLEKHPEAAGTAMHGKTEFPVLVKLIDAADDLAIQVHPDDAYARLHENQSGKEEMWYVIDAEPGAKLYVGLVRALTPEEFDRAIREKRLLACLKSYEVKAGDSFFIPAGTIHAIGAGCFVAEVQQNSNVTYRISDFDRLDAQGHKRSLHIPQAKDVAVLEPSEPQASFAPHLVSCPSFTVDLLKLQPNERQKLRVEERSFLHILPLRAPLEVWAPGQTLQAPKGQSLFVPAGSGEFTVSGQGEVLLTYLP